ncbi:MAG: M20 family metallopeptidase [Hyphomicrobiaceae bacterium]
MQAPDKSEMLDGIRRWVEIESHTADIAGVSHMMDTCAEGWRQAGAMVERIAGRDGYGDHLVVSSAWGSADPGILVLCHLDTVHPRGTIKDLPFRVDGDRVFGPGIYDMKGGAYLAFAAYQAIARAGRKTPLPLRFIYSADEEVGSPTSRALIEAHARNAKYVLVTEPARDGGKIVTSRKGVGRFVLTANGRPAHSGAKHEAGRSAILEVAHHVVDIEAMTDYARGVTFNVGQISGGTADNVVPALCTATIDMRVKSFADAEHFEQMFRKLKPYNPDVTVQVTGGLNRPPYEMSPAGAKLFAHAREQASALGIDLVGMATGGGSDGNFTAHFVPTIDGLGVDGDGAHTMHEHMLLSSLEPRMNLQRRLFETLT